MPTPTFRAAGTAVFTANNVSATTNLTPTKNASTVNGDLMVLITESRSNSATVATPTGWVLATGFPVASGTTSGGKIYVFTRIADSGGNDAPTVTWSSLTSGTSGDSSGARILSYQNALATQAGTVPSPTDQAATTTFNVPAITTTGSNTLVIGIGMRIHDTAHTFSMATYTERSDDHTTTGTGHGTVAGGTTQAAAGTLAAAAITPSDTTSMRVLAISVAFASTPITATVGQATSTGTAQAIAWSPKKRLVNQASSTNTSRPITAKKVVTVGQAVETDTSTAITTPIRRLVGQAIESSSATTIFRDITPTPITAAKWQYFLAESSDLTKLAEITNKAKDAQFELTINQPGSFQFRIPTNTDWNEFMQPVQHCIIATRDKTVVWSGPIWTKDEIFEAQSINITCVGWLEILFHRFYTGEGNVVSTTTNAGTIIYDMLALANADHDTWITEGTNTNTQTRTVTLEPFQNFGEQIKALTEVENGCDIEVDPETRELNIFAAEDYKVSPAVFDFNITRSNLQTFKRSIDAAQMANDWYVRGTVGTAQATDDNSIALTGQLLQQVISVSETSDISLLGAIANAELAVNSLPRVLHSFLPVSDPNKAPQFFEDWNIRDQIAVRAIRDGLVVEGIGPDFPYGDFEDVATGTTGWQTYNSPVGISRTITQAHGGVASAQVQTASTTANGIISNRAIASVNPSARYTYTIWVKAPVAYNYVVGVWLYEGNEISTLVPGAATFTNTAVAGTNAWQSNTLTFDTTKYTAYANIGVYCSASQTATSFYVDDVSLVLVGDSVAQKTRVFGAQISIDENGNQSVTNIQNTWQGGG